MRRYAPASFEHLSAGRFLPLLIVLLAAVSVFLPQGTDSQLTHADSPTVITDRSQYVAGETALISGTRFDPLVPLDVVVVRPDGSIVTGDGTETPGWDTVTTDESGAFVDAYHAVWRGKGNWVVDVYDSADTEHTVILAATTFLTFGPEIATDKPDYEPDESAIVSGLRFEPATSYDIPVTRPDGSIITGDGTGTPGWDTVTTDSSGAFSYPYHLDGLIGAYVVEIFASPWAGPGSSDVAVATITFTDMSGEIIVDDLDPGFSKVNLWGQYPTGGYNGHYYYVQNATSSDEAYGVWRPTIPKTRYYLVIPYIPYGYANTQHARYKISHESGVSTVEVNQANVVGFDYRWPPAGSKLGNFRLPAGTASYVRLGDATGEPYTSRYIGWDAMKFQPACVYLTEAELRDDAQPECRGTFVFDPGIGNYMTRAQLLANASYFISQGWPVNFLWYAPETTKSISTSDGVQWSACPWGTSPHSGSPCPSSALDFNRVTSSVPYGVTDGVFTQNVTIHAWEYGGAFIGRVCGNFSQSKSTPVPHITGFKWADLNGDGIWQTGEQALSNWEIILRDPNGVDHPTLTNSVGFYDFPIYYPPGTYTLRETLQPAWVNTKSPAPVTVNEGVGDRVYSQNNFGNRNSAQFTVNKDFVPDSGASVNVSLSCTSGSVSPASASASEASPATFTVTGFTGNPNCTATESPVPSGYTSTGTCSASLTTGSCTITNNHISPEQGHIIIDKVTNPSGSPQSFELFLTGGPSGLNQSFSLTDAATPHDSGAVLSGSGYSAAETVPTSWVLTSATCSDGSQVSNIDVGPEETVTCTFTNTKPPKLIVIKHVINDDGATAAAADFTMTVTANSPDPASFPGVEAPGTSVSLDAGPYSVNENGPSGYSAIFSSECSGFIAVGETKTCTVINDDVPSGTVIVEKQTIPPGAPGNFTFTGDLSGSISDNGQIVLTDLQPGTYFSFEVDVPAGFSLSSIVCDDDNSEGDVATAKATIRLDADESVVKCVFTNTLEATPTPPPSVGGVVEFHVGSTRPAPALADHSRASGAPYAAIACASALAVAFAAGVWCTRRRWFR